GQWLLPRVFQEEEIKIGPIPEGTPVGLIANLMVRPEKMGFWERVKHDHQLAKVVFAIKHRLEALGEPPPDTGDQATQAAFNARAREALKPLAGDLMSLSKCPDYIVNRGHYFGTEYLGEERALSDEDKRALIEFLKTF